MLCLLFALPCIWMMVRGRKASGDAAAITPNPTRTAPGERELSDA